MSTDSLLLRHHGHSPASANHNGHPMSVYEPLQSARHIRLLRVPASTSTSAEEESGSRSNSHDQEQYELVHMSLATCRSTYQAVSYV
jgi:hypothetical protein